MDLEPGKWQLTVVDGWAHCPMLKDNYKGINTLRKLLELVLLIFTTRKDMYFWADYLWTKEIMNYIFITTKECYSISIMLQGAHAGLIRSYNVLFSYLHL